MGRLVEWVRGEVSTKEVINDALYDVGEAVIAGVCSLRESYPATFRAGGILTPVMDRLCIANNHPVAQPGTAPPFTGGQCPIEYLVTVYRRVANPVGAGYSVDGNKTFAMTGPIEGFWTDGDYPCGSRTGSGSLISTPTFCTGKIYFRGSNPSIVFIADAYWASDDTYPGRHTVMEIVSITPRFGALDSCGDPPSPPYVNKDFDENDFTKTVDIEGSPNDSDTRNYEVTINFDTQLDENGNQCLTIGNNRYCFTPDGVEKQDDEPPSEEAPSPDELAPTAEEDVEDAEDDDLEIAYVTTEITTEPEKGKVVMHSDINDNDYFAGYFNWITTTENGSYRHPTIPIRKRLQIFARPLYATGYKAYTVNGAKLKVVVYKTQQEE